MMLKKILRQFKPSRYDILVYRMRAGDPVPVADPGLACSIEDIPGGKKYILTYDGVIVHQSLLFPKLRLLQLLGKTGPAIGDCVTHEQYRGRSIYPFVIGKMAVDALASGVGEVFIVVGTDNVSSIRGIEKAGFKKLARIATTRWLGRYWNVRITSFEQR